MPHVWALEVLLYSADVLFNMGFAWLGCEQGCAQEQLWMAYDDVLDGTLTWVKGSHTFDFGTEHSARHPKTRT